MSLLYLVELPPKQHPRILRISMRIIEDWKNDRPFFPWPLPPSLLTSVRIQLSTYYVPEAGETMNKVADPQLPRRFYLGFAVSIITN